MTKEHEDFEVIELEHLKHQRKMELVLGKHGEILGRLHPQKISKTKDHSLVERKVNKSVLKILQDAKMLQTGRYGAGHGSAKQLNVQIQIIGDKAIEDACTEGASDELTLIRILETLPEPRLIWMNALIMVVLYRRLGNWTDVIKMLGISSLYGYQERIQSIMGGDIIQFENNVSPDPGDGSPEESKELEGPRTVGR